MEKQHEIITVYTPNARRQSGLLVWVIMVKSVWQSRELILRLMKRDFSVRYRQSLLGYVWAVLPQIVTVALFTFLAKHRVFDMGETSLPYVLHALWSLSVWQLFSSCLVGSTNSLVNAGSLVTKINFTKEALVFASVGQAGIDFLIRLLPITAVFIWYGYLPSIQALAIPLILILVIMMALGIGFFMAILNLVFRDAGNAISMILTFGMFLAPILYPPPIREPFVLVNTLNPFSPLVIATQELLAGQTLSQMTALPVAAGIAIMLFLLGWRVFYITLPRIAERA
ncbi:ABC transporter permease [Methylicorpusculum sp.]|uniref:ABC transporter permease n=1 Tax=Methylicorpusculum sp. TaxID=2713644 RepID=UPI0027212A46|nr:ABC transporter permease [Methylicorpusculum sp.]MDO8846692.1 ABC transporter permease [Methylicorpusculum sp.]MDP2177806.1 ABC transporter permease [Methylicorpusculum sp.]MDZ4152121.1 ABC transporter permease [Methylicorpusculum sp.]